MCELQDGSNNTTLRHEQLFLSMSDIVVKNLKAICESLGHILSLLSRIDEPDLRIGNVPHSTHRMYTELIKNPAVGQRILFLQSRTELSRLPAVENPARLDFPSVATGRPYESLPIAQPRRLNICSHNNNNQAHFDAQFDRFGLPIYYPRG